MLITVPTRSDCEGRSHRVRYAETLPSVKFFPVISSVVLSSRGPILAHMSRKPSRSLHNSSFHAASMRYPRTSAHAVSSDGLYEIVTFGGAAIAVELRNRSRSRAAVRRISGRSDRGEAHHRRAHGQEALQGILRSSKVVKGRWRSCAVLARVVADRRT